jgi:hypothetical protein
VDVKWLLVAAGVGCACTVPDPSYIPPSGDAEVGSTAAEEAGDGMAGDESSRDDADTGASSTGETGGGEDETSTDAGETGADESGTDEGTSTSETDGGDGDGDTPFEHTSRDCADADLEVGMAEAQAVFNLHCIECHAPPSSPQGLDLTPGASWGSLVSQFAGNCSKIRVIPGDPAASYLLDKLENIDLCSGQPMPKNREPLTIEERNTIQSWICAGAPEA